MYRHLLPTKIGTGYCKFQNGFQLILINNWYNNQKKEYRFDH